MAKVEGCEFGKATRWVLWVLILVLLASVGAGTAVLAGARSDARANTREISGVREALARVEERQKATLALVEKIEHKLSD